MGEPHEAPPEGVLCIVAKRPDGKRYIASHTPFYCWDVESGEWWPIDMPGLLDRLRRNLIHAFKEGRSVVDEEFLAAHRRADQDPDFPYK